MTPHDAYQELVAADALDALDPRDRAGLDAHLATCAECRALLEDLRRVAVGLGASVEPVAPPPALKVRTMAHVTAQSQPIVPFAARTPAPAAAATRRRPGAWLALAASLALALSVGLYAMGLRAELASTRAVLSDLSLRLESLRSELMAARQVSARLVNTMNVLRSPDVIRVDLRATGPASGPAARAFVSATRGLIFDAENLPRLSAGRAYQLWVVPAGAGAAPVSAGVFTADPDGRSAMTVGFPAGVTQIAAVAVSEEPSGGSAQPTSAPFLVGTPVNN